MGKPINILKTSNFPSRAVPENLELLPLFASPSPVSTSSLCTTPPRTAMARLSVAGFSACPITAAGKFWACLGALPCSDLPAQRRPSVPQSAWRTRMSWGTGSPSLFPQTGLSSRRKRSGFGSPLSPPLPPLQPCSSLWRSHGHHVAPGGCLDPARTAERQG